MSIAINDLTLYVAKENRMKLLTAKQYDVNLRFLRVKKTNESIPIAIESEV